MYAESVTTAEQTSHNLRTCPTQGTNLGKS